MQSNMSEPALSWDVATGYDMFVSLQVLHDPGRYGLRAAWAAGVRSRLPERLREFLADAVALGIPFHWLHHLPEPKDGASALTELGNTPAGHRLSEVFFSSPVFRPHVHEILGEVADRGRWEAGTLSKLKSALDAEGFDTKKKELKTALELWAKPTRSGELYLEALRAFQAAFFAEEEQRIRPILEEATRAAQARVDQVPLLSLLEELSHGLRFSTLPAEERLVMVPSFWSTPLIADYPLAADCRLFLFGVRPRHISLVPGEPVPDDLHRALKAIADPTRLRILHYLSAEPLSPTELADRLRLRAPTVVHHLHALRLARLVQLTMESKEKRRYTLRPGAVETLHQDLQQFIREGGRTAD